LEDAARRRRGQIEFHSTMSFWKERPGNAQEHQIEVVDKLRPRKSVGIELHQNFRAGIAFSAESKLASYV
jgi:hypothetical protein